MGDKETMARHFLAALAYRTQKALRDAPENFGEFEAGMKVRTPKELVTRCFRECSARDACYSFRMRWTSRQAAASHETGRIRRFLGRAVRQ